MVRKRLLKMLHGVSYLAIISGLVLGGFVISQKKESPLQEEAKAAFTPDFKKSIDLNSSGVISPFTVRQWTGVQAFGEINGVVYAVVSGASANNNPDYFTALLRYNKANNTWSWVKSVYILIQHPNSKVLFWKNHLIVTGKIICENANAAAYDYQAFVNRRAFGGNHTAEVCNIGPDGAGNLYHIEEFPVTYESNGGTYSTSVKDIGGTLFMAVSNNNGKPFFLLKVPGFNGDGTLQMRAVRQCLDSDKDGSYNDRCSVPANPNAPYRAFDYNFAWNVDTTREDQNIRYAYILDSNDNNLRVLSTTQDYRNDTEIWISAIDKNSGRIVARSQFPLSPNPAVDRGNNTYKGSTFRFDSINVNGSIFLGFTEYTGSQLKTIVYRTNDLLNPGPAFQWIQPRTSVWGMTPGTFAYYDGTLVYGVFYDNSGVMMNKLFLNNSPTQGNNWIDTPIPNDQFGQQPYFEMVYHSVSANKIFASSTWNASSVSPSIWIKDLTPPAACSNMYWPGGAKTLTLRQGQSAVLTLDGTPPTLSGTAKFDFFDMADINNGPPYTALPNPPTSGMVNGRSTISVSYDYLKNTLRKKSVQINGVVPGGPYDSKCVVWLSIVYPPITNPNNPAANLSATCGSPTTPYTIRFSISSVSQENSIVTNRAYLLPKSGLLSIPNGYSAVPSIVIDASPATVALGYGATYTKQRFVQGQTSYWDFTLTFNKTLTGINSYERFYTSGGFDLFLYIADQSGDNLMGGAIPKATSFISVDPFQCAKPYYKTFGGDYRSNEKTNYVNPGAATRLPATNKFWQPTVPGGTFASVQNNNTAAGINQPVSSYSTEVVAGAQNCLNVTLSAMGSGYCSYVIDGPGLNQNDVTNQLATNIDSAVKTLRTLNKIDISNSNNNVPKTLSLTAGTITGTAPNITINLGLLNNTYAPLLIEIPYGSGINNITINDNIDTNPASINNVIVWCRTANCVMRINPVKSFAASTIVNSGTKLSYPSYLTNGYVKDKGRLYLNFNQSTESNQFSTSRKIYLEGAAGTQSNYYVGGFITDGYLFTDRGSSTGIIKGFLISRGIVVRDSGANIGDRLRNKYMYFRDYTNPFLYIDYDAKYQLTYRGLLVKPPDDVDRKYLGL